MELENRLIEASLHAPLRLPGAVQQWLISGFVSGSDWWECLTGQECRTVPDSEAALVEESERLMQVHYDMPLPLFQRMLGPTMKYSMGLWQTGAANLEEAQEAMMADLCQKAGVADGQHILDLGCGFGSFCTHLLKHYPSAKVTGLTLSQTQANWIRAQQEIPGHPLQSPRFQLKVMNFNDYRPDEKFHRVISIGVMEHVASLSLAMQRISQMLAPGGECFHHFIVYQPDRPDQSQPRQSAFISRYIFPGGRNRAYPDMLAKAAPLEMRGHWFLGGVNYRRTLEAWLKNFLEHREVIERETGLDQLTLRLWEVYLRGCIATFRLRGGKAYGNGQYRMA